MPTRGKRYIEIVDDDLLDRLTSAERKAFEAAFDQSRRVLTIDLKRCWVPSLSWEATPRSGLTRDELTRGYRALERVRAPREAIGLPKPPRPCDWRVWSQQQTSAKHWKKYAFTDDSAELRGKNANTRKVQASRALKRVEDFRRRCEQARRLWWFELSAALVLQD